ncbi:tandem-95 repeat protein [Telmatocola sphagniphila]|uniref:Tandem-95 repeat protein n=1 Tax=Telmatocola sphagniphila TaxID=1123043 RepID=A0A8E6B7K0_9BACT|nr:Ig-like domain-containing protein [Telmatocola sphagniphila]QVL32601.1 tandem-95 repeat protein [Telmatocola sphagniphila]
MPTRMKSKKGKPIPAVTPKLESLEDRTVMDGSVQAMVSGGVLFVAGDHLANRIQITGLGSNAVSISALDGNTPVNGRTAPVYFSNLKGVHIQLGGGDDMLVLNGLSLSGQLYVNMGEGNNSLSVFNTRSNNTMSLITNGGNDVITLSGVQAPKGLVLACGLGYDVVNIGYSSFGNGSYIVSAGGTAQFGITQVDLGKNLHTQGVSSVTPGMISVANADFASVARGASTRANLLANDQAFGGSAINTSSIRIVRGPASGSVTTNGDGSVTYTNNGGSASSDSFSYQFLDSKGTLSSVGEVHITVTGSSSTPSNPSNTAPVASGDSFTVTKGSTANLNLALNDTAPGSSLNLASIQIVTQPAHGTITINSDGSVKYVHDGSNATTDSFTYTIKNAQGLVSNTATVSLVIAAVNKAPVAGNDIAEVEVGSSKIINVAENDTSESGQINLGSIVIITEPVNGILVVNSDGTVKYTHDGSATVTDSFTYFIRDNLGVASNVATVTITIVPPNQPPVANPDSASVNTGGSYAIPVAANDSDPENALALNSIVITQPAEHGTLTVNPDGTVTYQHDGGATLSDSFKYTIKDAKGAVSNEATVTITIVPLNQPPVANPDTGTVAAGASLVLPVSANDTDPDNALDLSSITITQQPEHGTLTVNADGTVTYQHDGGLSTSDNFRYTIKDAKASVSNEATVILTILQPPVANNDSVALNVGGNLVISVLANDSAPSAAFDFSSLTIVSIPTTGFLNKNPDGTFTYIHDGSPVLSESFQYTIKDVDGRVSNVATVFITIHQPPVANSTAVTVPLGQTAIYDLTDSISDPQNDPVLQIVITGPPTHGTATVLDNNRVQYENSGDMQGMEVIKYRVVNSFGLSSEEAVISIAVIPNI